MKRRFSKTDGWCFALVNGRLAEIWWRKKKNGEREVVAHGYVQRKWFKTKKELVMIESDTKRHRFSYRNQKYRLLTALPKSPKTT